MGAGASQVACLGCQPMGSWWALLEAKACQEQADTECQRQINIITVLPAPLPSSPTLSLMVIIILIRGSAANGY